MDERALDALQAAVYRLVQRYVQRQRLPFEVIQKYRPRWVDSTQRRPSKEYASATGWGHWGQDNEWEYVLHGIGCRLTHTITGECIDWDAPNLYRFDPNWFVGQWLAWFLQKNAEDEAASIILTALPEQGDAFRKKIFDVLEQLHQSGKLRLYPDSTNKYELIV